jgi:hypothetical protein
MTKYLSSLIIILLPGVIAARADQEGAPVSYTMTTPDGQQKFRGMIEEQFRSQTYLSDEQRENAVRPFTNSHSRTAVEFEALTPVENYPWMNELLRKTMDYHRNVVKIVSFQGRRFFPEVEV